MNSPSNPGPDPALPSEPIGSDSGSSTAAPPSAAAPNRQAQAAEAGSSTRWLGVFLTTATTVFLAELGDKTQLAALLLSAESGRPVVVFVGASLALICSSLVGVLLGRWLSTVMAPEQLERAAGVLMVALGLWLGRQAVLNLAPLHLLQPGLAGLVR
ncbi:MAG: TMEM165/GDT1 family protein [Cyanobium sp. ELA712]